MAWQARAVAFGALLGCMAGAPAIDVTVNGVPVSFVGTPAQMVGGRVLVPLRGVLERLGAEVAWYPARRAVVASRGASRVDLVIGQRIAVVDDRPVVLDVPAQIIGGSTMVPLRFVGEALGAEVYWRPAAQTVEVITPPVDVPVPPAGPIEPPTVYPPVLPVIRSFDYQADRWLRHGSTLTATLRGTAGGQASLSVPGLIDLVELHEEQAGVYSGEWTVPADVNIDADELSVVGRLTVAGESMMIQSARPLAVDTHAPTLDEPGPPDGTRVGPRPLLTVTWSDGAGSGVGGDGVKLELGGREVTAGARLTSRMLLYEPPADLPAGEHTARVTVTDRAGNGTSLAWRFAVATAQSVIESFSHDGSGPLEPGDVIHAEMRAEAGGSASFRVGAGDPAPMPEVEPRLYRGRYTVRKGDDFAAAPVTGTFVTATGESYTVEASLTASVSWPDAALPVPSVLSPRAGERVGSSLSVSGRAEPGAQVRLRIRYETRLFGLVPLTGVLGEEAVRADEHGNWSSGTFDLEVPAITRDSLITISAWAFEGEEKRSESVTVVVRR